MYTFIAASGDWWQFYEGHLIKNMFPDEVAHVLVDVVVEKRAEDW